MTVDLKKILILNLPYLLFVYLFDKLCQAVRLAPGLDASEKFLHLSQGFTEAFSSAAPSLHLLDLLAGIAWAIIVRLAVYAKSKNTKKYRNGIEYGSARWGTAADIAPYIDPVPDWNIPLTRTESLTMTSRPKQPRYARNKNILVIGGSGSGKTRFFVKPSIMQMHSSYVITDPKGQLLKETGKMLLHGAPKLDENGKPIIGDMKVQDITTRVVDKYIQTLQKTKSVSTKTRKAVTTYVSDKTIEKIIKLLRCAFKQAVRWEIIARNPFDNVILPKTEYAKRDIWTADMIRLALDKCTDSKLYVAMNLSFACSLRMGEILGLTWENVHISDEDIAADNAYVYIDKELTRASKRAIETLGEKDIYYIFTPLMPNTSARIVLKKPKTDSSIRKVWLPKTLAYILREWKSAQDELRALLRDEYQDYDLVVALANGRPCEDRIILKSFEKLREKAGLPKVVFHSLRHSSTTYKLKLNHGDLKATQGDTGHAQIDMITSVYAHILDEDRKINARKFESAFYANPDLRSVRPPEEPKEPAPATLDLEALVEQLRKSPELANTLAALLASAPSEK